MSGIEAIFSRALAGFGDANLFYPGRMILPQESGHCSELFSPSGFSQDNLNKRILERIISEIPLILPRGILSEPPYRMQEQARTCVAASFLGVVEDITGEKLREESFMRYMVEKRLTEKPHIAAAIGFEVYSLLASDEFTNIYGQTRAYDTSGFGFNSIMEVYHQAKAYDLGGKIYYMPSMKSEVDPKGLHLNTLLYADQEHVYVHDPSNIDGVGGQVRSLEKSEYFNRWLSAGMHGILVVHFPNTPIDHLNLFVLNMA